MGRREALLSGEPGWLQEYHGTIPQPYILNPTPCTPNTKPQTLNRKPQSPHLKSSTLDPQPYGVVEHGAWMVVGVSQNDPQTLNPAPYTLHPTP